ncbi:MAG: hypothetical protein ACFFAS_18545 [Promethearchaeota archaeon]
MKKTTKSKNSFFFLIVITFSIIIGAIFIVPLSPSFNIAGETDVYITGDDVIKNFRFDSFDGEPLSLTGTSPGLQDKIKFEIGGQWEAHTNDISVQNIEEADDTIYMYYRIALTNKMNIFTNVDLEDACENLSTTKENLLAGVYRHYQLLGDQLYGWESYLTWEHYDFGQLIAHNTQNNVFEGDLVMSFDINDSPLPAFLTDSEGNTVTKEFDYIGISAVYIDNTITGKMSNDMPDISGISPREYKSEEANDFFGGDPGSMRAATGSYDPKPQLSGSRLSGTFDIGYVPQSDGSSLMPTAKGGSAIWDARTREESMDNCEFRYALHSLSPVVYKYSDTLTWQKQVIHTQDYIGWNFLIPYTGVKTIRNEDTLLSETRDVALHVTNRYIQTEITVVFNVWSSWKIEGADLGEYDGLDKPQEYYDDLVWQTTVDGFGGGEFEVSSAWSDFFDIFGLGGFGGILTLVIIGVVIYIAYRFLKRRKKQQIVIMNTGRP